MAWPDDLMTLTPDLVEVFFVYIIFKMKEKAKLTWKQNLEIQKDTWI